VFVMEKDILSQHL